MARNFLVLLLIVAAMYGVVCVVLLASQRDILYQPQRSAVGGSGTRFAFAVEGAVLQISVRNAPGKGAVIYFGGNAENVSSSLNEFASAFPRLALYFMNYRGYGGSTGKPTERSIEKDALALFDKVYAQHPYISVVGRSLGSGVAIRVASQRLASRLVLITPYNSIQEIAQQQFPYLPVRFLLFDKFESWRYAPTIKIPTLLIAAERDEVIPLSSSQRLLHAFAPGIAAMKVIPFFGHNDISDSPLYFDFIRSSVLSEENVRR